MNFPVSRTLHRKLGVIIASFALVWCISGVWLEWQTWTWVRAWPTLKQQKIEQAQEGRAQALLESLGQPGRTVLELCRSEADLNLRRLSRVEFDVLGHRKQVRLEFLAERNEWVTIDWEARRVISRERSEAPSWVQQVHTGQFLGVYGFWIWIVAALVLVLTVITGLKLTRAIRSPSSPSPS